MRGCRAEDPFEDPFKAQDEQGKRGATFKSLSLAPRLGDFPVPRG